MKQQSLIYSFVARGTTILADYTEFTGNFATVASQCLSKLPSSSNKFTYTSEGHTFNYLVDNNGFTYCVVATESIGRQVPIAFLERIKDEFIKKCGAKGHSAVAHSLTHEFGPKLKEQMQYCVDHREELNKLAKVEAQVTEIKGVMVDNIEKVLDRGEKIEVLVDKTEDLRAQAQDFKAQGTKVKRKLWFENMKIKLMFLCIVLLIMIILIVSVCLGAHRCGRK